MMPAAPPATPPGDAAARQRQALVRWFMRRHGAPASAPWSAADEQAFQQWLGSPANRQAYARWQADWALIDAMPPAAADRLRAMAEADLAAQRAAAAPPAPGRRQWLGQGLALAGVAGMVLGSGWLGWRHLQAQPVFAQAFSTRQGQQIAATLPDGSTIRLDTATTLQVALFRGRREVRLAQGQAFFAVAADARRPFSVMAGGAVVTVLGTRFAVRYTPGVPGREGVEVAVEEGRVRVARGEPGGGAAQPFELAAGQTLRLPPGGADPVPGAVPAAGVAPWRSMPLSFSDVPLREAVAEMERYASLGIAAIDPAVAGLRLSGTFDPRDPEATRRLLARALPIRLEDSAQGVHVRPVR